MCEVKEERRATTLEDELNVGILGMEVYIPSLYIRQDELEKEMGVSAGRYTIGLGQSGMALPCGDVEDINSISLTVVDSLLKKYDIDPSTVGRLEVGTETLVDKSKSTKTILMSLFSSSKNTNIEGATVLNACYGGTAALLNAICWCQSNTAGWTQQRPYAIVVAADIATYARGPARPTCGVGAVALLIGRDAPLAFAGRRATHASHTWDFFKPNPLVEHPTVQGALSQQCYYQALEDVYTQFSSTTNNEEEEEEEEEPFMAATTDNYMVFHAPYNKLVQKSFARLFLLDARRYYQQQQKQQQQTSEKESPKVKKDQEEKKENPDTSASSPSLSALDELVASIPNEYLTKPIEETYTDKALEKILKQASQAAFTKLCKDANRTSQFIGNTYTASVFMGLASLVHSILPKPGQQIVVFSYGSGALATMYQLQVRQPTTQTNFTVEKMAQVLDLTQRLANREKVHPRELDHAMETRAHMHRHGGPYTPVYPTIGRLLPGTYYLEQIGSDWTRSYKQLPMDAQVKVTGNYDGDTVPLAPPSVLEMAAQNAISTPARGRLVTEHGNHRIACVITGIAAGLPGSETVEFGENSLERLIKGEQCITPIKTSAQDAMLEKNVVQVKKHPDGTAEKIKVNNKSLTIQLAAQLGRVDLTNSYGVPRGLAETMDVAAQVAVAAGLEALKSAGLVSGNSSDPSEWKLPPQYRDSTGVVYASSFPAMDAAVGEVMKFLESRTVGAADTMRLISALRQRMVDASPEKTLNNEDEAAFAHLIGRATAAAPTTDADYIFDRKFLFRVLVLGNAQLAQLAGCQGPNTQTNAACAGTTQAIAMAQDMLISGRARRVVVVAGDNASGDILLPWLGSGFRALGAATTQANVSEAACPFDKRRSGMLLGAGAIGLVLETEASFQERKLAVDVPRNNFEIKARLVATQYSNSAFHGAALDRKHIGKELSRFLTDVEVFYGITKADICNHGVYFSHETCTHASDASSCAGNEVAALLAAFGKDLLSKLLILNTKGFTGHPMGVSFEDVTAVQVLLTQRVPPVPNYKEKDDYLGDLNISTEGGEYPCKYALRFAAGFGSQVAFALYTIA